ncbi:trigger factor [Lamprobacter modestohalophilus]|uniref:trigger factor n=1 Tax=Lamprobacter modestohalophilus TaxID=1064514 RepID=UPI002ADEAEC2|nr:trigger factor [Lamprobacter modestohalophilus]MEA1050271.1 trigger factor [Lamprobacter modestohalophilus]
MQVSVETGDGLTRRLKVELPAEDIEQEIEKRLQNIARSARMPGFRPGKVPLRVLRQRYGDSMRLEVFGERVEASFPQAIAESELRPAGRPEIEPDLDQTVGRYAYVAEFEVIPEVTLTSLEGRTLARPQVEVTDTDVEETIERLRQQRKRWEAVERASETGDRLTVDFDGQVDGEAFEGGQGEGIQIEIGAGRFIPGFEDQLVGASAGDERSIDVTFPEDYPKSSLAGKPAQFKVRVKTVEAPNLPEVDAEFVAEFGVDDGDLERFRADVRANLERERSERVKARIKNQVMDLLLEANPIMVPSALVANEIESLRQQMTQNLGAGSEFKLPDEIFADNAQRRVALGLIVGEVVKANELTPDPERVRSSVEEMAATYDDPQAVIDYYYADRQRLATVESVVLEDLVVERVLEQIEVTDEPISFSELTSQQ